MKKRIYIAMDHEGDIDCNCDRDDLVTAIAEDGHILAGYRLVAIDIEMTPPAAVDEDAPADATVTIPDTATAAPTVDAA